MQNSRSRRDRKSATRFAVGTTVVLSPHNICGVVIDLVLNEELDEISFAIVAFETGGEDPTLYQPIRWNLLRRARGRFVVNAAADAIETGVPAALSAMPLSYGGNARCDGAFSPTPRSVCVH